MNRLRSASLLAAGLLLFGACGHQPGHARPAADAAADRSEPVAAPTSTPSPTPDPAAQTLARPVTVVTPGWWSWMLLDWTTGVGAGSPNAATQQNTTESMIKAWLAADYVAGVVRTGRGLTTKEVQTIQRAVRVSDDNAAEWLWDARGRDDSIARLISTCGLTGTAIEPDWWSLTRITAQDAVRMGACLVSGQVLSQAWQDWLLGEMRSVAMDNAFGIQQAWPAGPGVRIAVKNGWTAHGSDNQWHVNCLALWDRWVLAVLTHYPAWHGIGHGAEICRQVAAQLFPQSPLPPPAPMPSDAR